MRQQLSRSILRRGEAAGVLAGRWLPRRKRTTSELVFKLAIFSPTLPKIVRSFTSSDINGLVWTATSAKGFIIWPSGAVKCPPLSTVPQPLPAQPAPETAYTIVGSGFPAEEIPAAKSAAAPSSTLAEEDKKLTAMSLVIPICALPLLKESAALVAVTVTFGSTGRSRGAVYSPAPLPVEVIVPTELLPPAIPFTAQVTPVFVVLLTVAVKLCVAPSSTAPDGGETVTVIVGGGGGGGGATGLTPPPPQPSVHAPAVRSTHRNTATTPVWRLVPHTDMHRGEATHPPPSAIIRRFRSHVVFASLGPSRSESKSKVLWHLGLMRTYFHRSYGTF